MAKQLVNDRSYLYDLHDITYKLLYNGVESSPSIMTIMFVCSCSIESSSTVSCAGLVSADLRGGVEREDFLSLS